MTDMELRIRIAELVGWTTTTSEHGTAFWKDGHAWPLRDIPDYPNDLNALREAYLQCVTSGALALSYFDNLMQVLGLTEAERGMDFWAGSSNDLEALHNATARQRAEAFVKAMEGDK
jgi:hypothetical protein